MDYLQPLIDTIDRFRLAHADQWAALTLFVGVFALVAALAALRKQRPGSTGQITRVGSRLDSLELKVDAERNRRETGAQDLLEQISGLEARIEELELELAGGRNEAAAVPAAVTKPAGGKQTGQSAAAPLYVPTALTLGLKKTRSGFFGRLRGLFSVRGGALEQILPGLEELLLSSDLGVKTADQLLQNVRERFSGSAAAAVTEAEVIAVLQQSIEKILASAAKAEIEPRPRPDGPLVILVVGVNGVGKTTTIGKLAAQFKNQGASVLLGACDTFRAAAVEQLRSWADRTGCELLAGGENAKPSTVAYQALARAKQGSFDVLILDTAGRLHTRSNLMNELEAVIKIVGREYPGAPHETLLVLDASTGQNALLQAREFNQRGELSGVIVTKLDGTPKGGIIVAIKEELGVPIRYIGVGEGIDDLRPFSAKEFAAALFEDDDQSESPAEAEAISARAAVRRRRREDIG